LASGGRLGKGATSWAASLLGLAIVVALLAGFTSTARRSGIEIRVTPSTSLAEQPLDISVFGLDPDQQVTIAVRSTDANTDVWQASATFRSDTAGTVNVNQTAALSGSYTGTVPMGLIETMSPVNTTTGDLEYFWSPTHPLVFNVSATVNGRTVATTRFNRAGAAQGVRSHDQTISATGFYGQYWTPPPGTPRHPAILEFGGSEGGLDGQLLGGGLASAGYPTLDIAYFDEPGLPATLKDIPLRYFARALTWLSHQPQVNPQRLYVLGASRGSEAALLLGAHYPNLVYGVIANSPSDISFSSYPKEGSPAWTFNGKPVPYSHTFSSSTPTEDPAADIPVQHIRGPVFLDCGTDDQVWTSCAYAQAVQGRLAAAHDPDPHVLYEYDGGGHFVGDPIPYQPVSPTYNNTSEPEQGLTALADYLADAQLWPHLLTFLADPAAVSGTFITDVATPAA
jgi:dienelactone hydrolase